MSPELGTRRLLRESAPVAVVLSLWSIPASFTFVRPAMAAGLFQAGAVMALLYTVVRGVELADDRSPPTRPEGLADLLRENGRVAVPAAVWFVVAKLAYSVEHLWEALGIAVAFKPQGELFARAFAGAGVAAVLLYAIVAGLPRVRRGLPTAGEDATADEN